GQIKRLAGSNRDGVADCDAERRGPSGRGGSGDHAAGGEGEAGRQGARRDRPDVWERSSGCNQRLGVCHADGSNRQGRGRGDQHRGASDRLEKANGAVTGVRHVDVPCTIYGQAVRTVQLGAGGQSAVARVAQCASAGDGGDDASEGDFANSVVVRIRNEKVAGVVYGNECGGIELGVGGRSAIARIAYHAVTGYRGDEPAGRHPANTMVARVCNVEVAVHVYSHAGREVQLGGCRQPAIARVQGYVRSVAGYRSDEPARPDFANPAGAILADVEATAAVHGDALWSAQLGKGRWPAIAQGEAA